MLQNVNRIFLLLFGGNRFNRLIFSLLLSSSFWNLILSAALHHKTVRSKSLFALNNFTDLYGPLATQQASAAAIRAMDLTSIELNTIDVGEIDSEPSSRNLQLDTKENTEFLYTSAVLK